jgi:hypothetical protein
LEYPKIETLYERNLETFKVIPGKYKNRTYTIPKFWHWTEKIDGQNIRVCWSGATVWFGGKSEESQIHAQLYARLQALFPPEKLAALYPGQNMIFYGEGYGPGIQKNGAGYIDHKDFILFDVLVDQKWWLNWEAVNDVGAKAGLQVVPEVGTMDLECATEYVRHGFASQLNGGVRQAEGLVGRTVEPLFDKKGHRLIVKLKTKDFAREAV